jgi:hypothetical protein
MYTLFLMMFFGSLIIHMYLMPLVMTNNIAHIQLFSLNKFYNATFMAFSMVLLETFMHPSLIVSIISLIGMLVMYFMIRYQVFIREKQYLKDMIEHHSMAILTSKRLIEKEKETRTKTETNVIKLASNILETQKEEVSLMQKLLVDKDILE